MKRFSCNFAIVLAVSLVLLITSCATTGSTGAKTAVVKNSILDSCIVDDDYDFIFELVNNTNEAITFSNGIKKDQMSLSSVIETKKITIESGDSYQIKYNLDLMQKKSGFKKEEIQFFTFMTSENKTVMEANPRYLCIYNRNGRYINDRFMYKYDQGPQLVLAERKYSLILTNVEDTINVSAKIEDLSGFVYDEIVPGNGRDPVKLQLRNSKEYVEVGWRYCRYAKENSIFTSDGNLHTSMDGGEWIFCNTEKKRWILLNYNRNNDYWSIPNRDLFRPYTVEELEILIGVKPPLNSVEGVKISK